MIPDAQLDFDACVLSGQVFRFKRTDEGWAGIDGTNLIEAKRVPGGWEVESRPNRDAWKAFLQIDRDFLDIRRRIASIEPRLIPMLDTFPGLRTLRLASPAETLFSFLCTANNHMSRIVRMTEFLASKGEELEAGHYIFPSVVRLADTSEQELRANGFGYRGATIPAVAKTVLENGDGWLNGLKTLDYLDARAELCRLPGVGLKLADCVCLFGLHFDEAAPIDTHVWKTLAEWYAPVYRYAALSPSRYVEVSNLFRERFGDISAWAQQYVFYNQYISYRTRTVTQV